MGQQGAYILTTKEDFTNPKKRRMIPLGKIEINFDLFVNKQEVEDRFPFQFRDALYGERSHIHPDWGYDISGNPHLVEFACAPLIGQIIKLPNGGLVKIQQVYINYWQQIGAHGELIESLEEKEQER